MNVVEMWWMWGCRVSVAMAVTKVTAVTCRGGGSMSVAKAGTMKMWWVWEG